MKNADKIQFIFQTGGKARMHIENEVFRFEDSKNSLLSELSTIQMKVAMQIHQAEPLSLSQLADALGLSHPSASVIVDKLVEKKVVSREPDPEDRRRVQLRIHQNAAGEMNEIQNRFQKAFEGIASKVGDENIERWYQVALKIQEILQEENERV